MTVPLGNPNVTRELVRQFDLRGRFTPGMEEFISPVVNVGTRDVAIGTQFFVLAPALGITTFLSKTKADILQGTPFPELLAARGWGAQDIDLYWLGGAVTFDLNLSSALQGYLDLAGGDFLTDRWTAGVGPLVLAGQQAAGAQANTHARPFPLKVLGPEGSYIAGTTILMRTTADGVGACSSRHILRFAAVPKGTAAPYF